MSDLKPLSKLRLNRPFNQNIIVGCILFCLPGIYLALTGLGAGGGQQSSQQVASTTNAILYGLFTLFGWIGGGILNLLKPKITIMIGAVGYPLYVGGLWYFDRQGNDWFPYFGGAVLGCTAGCLWTAAGFIQFAYANEDQKGLFITWQWVLTSFGGTVGSLIAFGINVHATQSTGVSNAVYVVFIVIMCMSIVLAFFFIVDPKTIVRDDGTHIAVFHKANVISEIKGTIALFADWRILALVIPTFVAEMCLALMSSINAYYFNLRTRSLNNVMFQFVMIPAPLLFAWILDTSKVKSRRLRGLTGVTVLGAITLATSGGLAAWIKYNDVNQTAPARGVDWTDSTFAAAFILYILFGIIYAIYQIAVQWTLAALSNDPVRCARHAGFFKGTTSLGMCVSFILDSQTVSYMNQLIVQFVLYFVGLICLYCIIGFCVSNTNYFHESDVIVPKHIEEEAILTGVVVQEDVQREHEKEKIAEESVQPKHH